MPDLSYQQAYQRAVASNSFYSRYQDRWQFLMDSYQGGDAYRNGQYLQRYQLEKDAEYQQRLANTPLDNQVRGLINLYVSFLFRQSPDREFESLEYNPTVEAMLEDADLDGRNMDAFMKDVATWSSVFGHVWVCVAKPSVGAITLADELAQNARPYLSLYTPLSVTDWRFQREPNGSYALNYIKVLEEVSDTETRVVEWTPETITSTLIDTKQKTALRVEEYANELGRLPWICVYAERSPVRGLGQSLVDDIADQQRMIYNELSEVYDSIRLDTHPSLVATNDTQVHGAAAGQIITMPESMDPNLKPYVLQFQGGQIEKIYLSIDNRRKMIDSMGNVGAVRATESREMSGVAIETEFQLLNARLTNIADNLELAEEQIWQEVCLYLGLEWEGTIKYPDDFALRNIENELQNLVTAYNTVQDPARRAYLEHEIMEAIGAEDPSQAASQAFEQDYKMAEYDQQLAEEYREYDDGTPFAADLPEAYAKAAGTENCGNCGYWAAGRCVRWNNAQVRAEYWCAAYEPSEE